jgi:hypothetical protein
LFLLAADLKESFYFLLMHHRALDLIKLFVVKRKTPASLRGLSEIYLVLHKNRRVKPFGALTAYWPEPL